MATSGTYNFALPNSDLVLECFDRIDLRGPALTSNHMISARRSLNLELQRWSNKGPNLPYIDLQVIPLVAGQATYTIPANTISVLDVYFQTPLSTTPVTYTDRIMESISRTDYASYANKAQLGNPTVYWFDRLNVPTLTFYQTPQLGSPYQVSYYRMRQVQDANLGSGETPDINYRFNDALCAGVTARLAEKYAKERLQEKLTLAKMAWDEAAAEDHERAPVMVRPRLQGYWTP